MPTLETRRATVEDAAILGPLLFEAFESVAIAHGFPNEIVSRESAQWQIDSALRTSDVVAIVALEDGKIVGCAVADESQPLIGVGPVVVAPDVQHKGIGRQLLTALLARDTIKSSSGVRLVQAAYNPHSFALFSKIGFRVFEPLCVLNGPPPRQAFPDHTVRAAHYGDALTCNQLCERVYGHHRFRELGTSIDRKIARVVERSGKITGYATGFGYGWHVVAQENEDAMALLSSADAFHGLGILVPSANWVLLEWCLSHGLQVVHQATLMILGEDQRPAGTWLPSVIY